MTFTIISLWAPFLLKGLISTLLAACGAIAIGLSLGICMGIILSSTLFIPGLSHIISCWNYVLRGTPQLVQIFILYYALPDLININLNPFIAGMIGLGINSAAYVSETVRSGMNAVSRGQWEASQVLGYSKILAVRAIIMPQVFRLVLPSVTNELVTLIKDTAVLSTIGVLELTKVGMNMSARYLTPMPIYISIAGMYLFITSIIALISKKIEKGINCVEHQ